jgi:hypothetical protein
MDARCIRSLPRGDRGIEQSKHEAAMKQDTVLSCDMTG